MAVAPTYQAPAGNTNPSPQGNYTSTPTLTNPTQDAANGINNGTSGVPAISSTPAVISSKDSSAQFSSNQTALQQSQTPVTPPVTGGTTTTTTAANGLNTDTTSTAVEKGAAAGAGDGSTPIVSSGDPIYDSLQKWESDQETKNEQNAADQKAQVQSMLQMNLANTNAGFAAQLQGISASYSSLIATQTQINNQNIARVKAYGLASGNAMSTPIEFTYAVAGEEQTALSALQKLDDARDAAIASATAAEQDADSKLLSDSMASVQQIEKDMQDQASALQTQLDDRYATLNKIKADQQAQLQKTQQSLIASALTTYGSSWASETDPTKQDATIKQIVNQSGGQLDYGTVYGALSSNAAALTKAKQDAATSAADIGLKGAQTAEAYANAQKTSSANNTTAVFSAVDNALGVGADGTPMKVGYGADGKPLPGADPSTSGYGTPYTDASTGYMTKAGFQMLSQSAAENGTDRAAFLKEYGGYLDPNAYGSYGLTTAEQDQLTDTSKATNIVIPTQISS